MYQVQRVEYPIPAGYSFKLFQYHEKPQYIYAVINPQKLIIPLLQNLGFQPGGRKERGWLWQDVFYIVAKEPDSISRCGKTKLIKFSPQSFTGDERENILFAGHYIFNNEEFALKLLKNTGVLEKINGAKLTEPKEVNHRQVLTNFGFTEIEANIWTKNIFLIALKPPKFELDRGKCVILKKPNVKKLEKNDKPAKVVYKGRYFLDDAIFTETLLAKTGFYYFENGHKNKTYTFNREILAGGKGFIEEAFLSF